MSKLFPIFGVIIKKLNYLQSVWIYTNRHAQLIFENLAWISFKTIVFQNFLAIYIIKTIIQILRNNINNKI